MKVVPHKDKYQETKTSTSLWFGCRTSGNSNL